MTAFMARLIALAPIARPAVPAEILRAMVVCGCALALILARAELPF